MAVLHANSVLGFIRELAETETTRKLADRELLARFVRHGDETAFKAIVRRHGPMVFRLCQRVLRSEQDAEDAFQATFLVLAKKAHALQRPESIGGWLFGVASRLAANMKKSAARRRSRESLSSEKTPADPLAEISVREAQEILDEELSRLQEKYQTPFVLCCLEGMTRDEAARSLGLPVGTLRSRLERARELLLARLVRRGLTITGALAAAVLSGQATCAAMPPLLVDSTVKAAVGIAAGGAASAIVSAKVAALTEGVLTTMYFSKLKIAATALVLAGLLGAGVGGKLAVSATSAGQSQVAQAQSEANSRNPSTTIASPFPEKAVTDKNQDKDPEPDEIEKRIEQYERAFRAQTEIGARRSEKTILALTDEELLRLLVHARSLPVGLQKGVMAPARESEDRIKKLREGLLAQAIEDVFVDFLGRPPTPDQVKTFLEDKAPNREKRALGQMMALRMIEKGTDLDPTLLKKYVRSEDNESLKIVIREGVEFSKLRLHQASKTLQELKDDKSARETAGDIERTARVIKVLLSLPREPAQEKNGDVSDPRKVSPSITKEPTYVAQPYYMLLVLGPDAGHRVWLVRDGGRLFLDRNGNGDLTDDGEALALKDGRLTKPIILSFGESKYSIKSLEPIETQCCICVETDGKCLQYAGVKATRRWEEAPVLHFGGPLVMGLDQAGKQLELRRGQENKFPVVVATAGERHDRVWGPVIDHNSYVPKDAHPVATFEFPSAKKGTGPVTVKISLTQRC